MKTLPDVSVLRDAFVADHASGHLYWRHGWRAGKEAGSPTSDGYRQVRVSGALHMVHRILWALHHGENPADEIDHVDGDPSNNAIANLRAATHGQNMQNAALRSDNRSGVKGVSWCRLSGKWKAQIHLNGGNRHLGCFASLTDAKSARIAAEKEHFGEFARTAA